MHIDVDIEPTLRFPDMTSIEKQMDQGQSKFAFLPQTDRR